MRPCEFLMVIAGLALALPASAALGAGMRYEVYGGLALSAERLTLSHDASSYNPLYGNPTSLLDYAPLTTVLPQLGFRGTGEDGGFIDVLLEGPTAVTGTFTDSDYWAGGTLSSETFSAVAASSQFTLQLKASIPNAPILHWQGLPLEPYVVARVGHRTLSAMGLTCGRVCPISGSIDPAVHVIDQDFLSGELGAGAQTQLALSDTDSLRLSAELTAGAMHVADSHNLRPDLGPTPNVLYTFGTIGVGAGIGYAHRLSGGLTLSLGLDGRAGAGFGVVDFAPNTPTPAGPFPAISTDVAATLSAGLSAAF